MDYEEAKHKLDEWTIEMMDLEEDARKKGNHTLESQAHFAWTHLEGARLHIESIHNKLAASDD